MFIANCGEGEVVAGWEAALTEYSPPFVPAARQKRCVWRGGGTAPHINVGSRLIREINVRSWPF
jgi:hypothetical protein